MVRALLASAAILSAGLFSVRPTAQPPIRQACTAPRVSQWSSIRDTLWPLLVHRDGDQLWAHFDSVRTPGQTATWCNPLQNDAEALAAARTLYANSCAVCHGPDGKGDGVGAGTADPRPYDFTLPEFAGMRSPPGTAILYAIMTRGIDGTAMPGFAAEYSGWERLALMAYITSLPGPAAISRADAWADSLRARRNH
jgi:mono/diheme cytochrome c family protein